MTVPIEYSVRNDEVVKAGRLMFQKHELEVKAVEKVERLKNNGFADDSVVMLTALRDLDEAGLMKDGAILDFSDTMRQAHTLEVLRLHDIQRSA